MHARPLNTFDPEALLRAPVVGDVQLLEAVQLRYARVQRGELIPAHVDCLCFAVNVCCDTYYWLFAMCMYMSYVSLFYFCSRRLHETRAAGTVRARVVGSLCEFRHAARCPSIRQARNQWNMFDSSARIDCLWRVKCVLETTPAATVRRLSAHPASQTKATLSPSDNVETPTSWLPRASIIGILRGPLSGAPSLQAYMSLFSLA